MAKPLPKLQHKSKPKTKKEETQKPKSSYHTDLFHKCECLCLENIPGHPYRIGYAKRFLDIDNKHRCVYCNCLTPDQPTLDIKNVS